MLGRALVELGWQLDVVTLEPDGIQATSTAGLRIERVFPGFYAALLRWAKKRKFTPTQEASSAVSTNDSGTIEPGIPGRGLNWKGRAEVRLRSMLGYCIYPDIRAEAMPFLRSRIERMLRAHEYDLAILSHEPPLALDLVNLFRKQDVPVIADLGDPVCAEYTPRRWRRRALGLEATVCRHASAIVVTTDATRQFLGARHAGALTKAIVVPQGFEPRDKQEAFAASRHVSTGQDLRVVYTGRFYRFRDPRETISAITATPGVQLVLAVPNLPDWLDPEQFRSPSIKLGPSLSHQAARALQGTADILLVLGNDYPAQTPGKLYEYFAWPIPILYVARHSNDPAAQLVTELKRGMVARGADQIATALVALRDMHRAGRMQAAFDLSHESVSPYTWRELARRYSGLMTAVARRDAPKP